MKIERTTIEKIADLARISIKEEEIDGLSVEMNKILTFMEALNTLDTTGVEPLVYMNEGVNSWRADTIKDEMGSRQALSNAPVSKGSYFAVPKVIEK
ncbi:MAG: Asp-tRNA(Asn)/Glu-tRNA(Gln) amidotransferase subunit GatC [Sphingobacteriales bacterium]|nr:MAG: Asp-tRNA(Asn)/Glu-tRNA(Gln) amidotransferase subunit GatC [Sphingobacteriales bacterium]